MDHHRATAMAERLLEAWNTQEVKRVVDCYTDDVRYRDPNTRGFVEGADAMSRYLEKLSTAGRCTGRCARRTRCATRMAPASCGAPPSASPAPTRKSKLTAWTWRWLTVTDWHEMTSTSIGRP